MNILPEDWPRTIENPNRSLLMDTTEAAPVSTVRMTPTPRLALGFTQQTPTPWNSLLSLQEDTSSMTSMGSLKDATIELKCTWTGCPEHRVFKRQCEFNKHMNKHTRPYSCQDAQCHGRDFGDKAGLQRHEKEKHGNEKFCCSVRACPRSSRGFGRKRNLELHILSRHKTQMAGVLSAIEGTTNQEQSMTSDALKIVGGEDSRMDSVGVPGLLVAPEGIESLRVTLWELEAKKTELAQSQAKVDADIDSLKRAMQLVLKE
ncbi:hypothetical protein N431DRAFT_433712 [Stipitochalara longipes BDJ]|nr:hypothetical protein N431DRAFT_433712 [Stipitochalara longipes BDJ]